MKSNPNPAPLLYKWTSVKEVNFSDSLNEWKKIRHLFPPSFLNCWVMASGKKCKAYFDAPNRQWWKSTKDVWSDPMLFGVTEWKEIESETFKKQLDNAS